jgi:outer membrane protein assembly factor BamB
MRATNLYAVMTLTCWVCLLPPAQADQARSELARAEQAKAERAPSEQWGQWRGPERNGVAAQSPPLIDSLPDAGLQPLWVSEATIRGGGNGGWASPVVADGRVYQYVHWRQPLPGVALGAEQYPALSDEQKGQMGEAEVREYESNRREEQLERRQKSNRHIETVYCFDAQDGSLQWQSDRDSVATGFSQSCTPVVADGRIFLHGADRKMVCLDARNGEVIWQTQMPVSPSSEQMPSSPLLVDGVVVVLMGRLVGVDAQSGEILWEGDAKQTAGQHSSPVAWRGNGETTVIVNGDGGRTFCVDPQTGEVHWNIDSKATKSTPVIVGDRLLTYGHSRNAGLRCFDLTSNPPEELWAFRGAADSGSSPVVVDQFVYVQGESRLACVDLESGKAAWQTLLDLNRPRYTSLVAADEKVFYVFDGLLSIKATPEKFSPLISAKFDEEGRAHSEDYFRAALKMDELERTAEGQQRALEVWQENIGRHGPLDCASPAVVDGRMYIRLKSRLACYDLRQSD